MFRVDNFVVLGEVNISDNEKKFLNVHFKYRETQKLRPNDLEMEIAKTGRGVQITALDMQICKI